MNALPSFTAFFHALWTHDPFPWQSMLAERVANGPWPKALDLPTASGKTACIEIALYALAAQADRATSERTAPRRIWFVVDRRIVVDEAHDRAEKIAKKLREARDGPLREIADRLRKIAGIERPLAIARLRGGIFRDDGWARLPSQPAVITSTVDQLGSRLLFRGYGRSQLAAPIFAGLAANDSLIFLDEAHCSVPFLQTLSAIETYRGARWAEAPISTPFSFVILSATPPADIPRDATFPSSERERALDHPVLRKRLEASKRAELVEVKERGDDADGPLFDAAIDRVLRYLEDGKKRVGVIVNRVRTAESVASTLRERIGDTADVVLLTGRMRPLERDQLVARWKSYLRASSPDDPSKPIVLIATQCLEVGADFSFDALVSEAASLDALRQRFGRLDRMGSAGTSSATILIRRRDADPDDTEPDPIYGSALPVTWRLLSEHAESNLIDFGVEAIREQLRDVDDLAPCLAPTSDAPVLLPAHLDLLCQTSFTPHPEPHVPLFLHGKERGAPEVRVVWRADLAQNDTRTWIETVALCPPVSGEMLAVPLYRFRAFLTNSSKHNDVPDLEGVPDPGADDDSKRARPCLLWRGRDRSGVTANVHDIMSGDVIVLPAAYGITGLGQSAPERALGDELLDIWEPAFTGAARPPAVRLNREVLSPWLACPPVNELITLAEEPEPDREAIRDGIEALLNYIPDQEGDAPAPPDWWLGMLREVRARPMEKHPRRGVVLFGAGSAKNLRASEPDLFADDDDLTSASGEAVSLDEHSELVKRTVEKLATNCLPEEFRPVLSLSAYWHDVGKLDERFQTLLHNGDELAALSAATALAKSAQIPTSPARRRAIRAASGLPEPFRHEMLSTQLAARYAAKPENEHQAQLFLHLVASHHGYARPFAPVSADPNPPAVVGRFGGAQITLTAEERAQLRPAHVADSGLADNFWRLVRRHGWWGLAYLEALVRLGDWYASGLRLKDETSGEPEE